MATLILEELPPAGPAGSGPSAGVRLEFSSSNRSSHRGPLEIGVRQRIARDLDPGNVDPVVQVLGADWKAFPLSGEWEDRFLPAGTTAEQIMESMVGLVERGNPVRISLGSIVFVAHLEDLDLSWFHAGRIGWKVQVSPVRRTAAAAAVRRVPERAPSLVGVLDYLRALQELTARLELHLSICPKLEIKVGISASIGVRVSAVLEASASASALVEARATVRASATAGATATAGASAVSGGRASASVGAYVGTASALGAVRVVQAFRGAATAATALLKEIRGVDSTSLAWESASSVLAFTSWTLDLQTDAILIQAMAAAAARDLEKRIGPDALALYQTQAGELLAGISMAYFGTPHRWAEIMRRNGLRSPVLAGGELLVIPR